MRRYVAMRLLALIPVLLSIALLTFLLLSLIPGDPAQMMLGTEASPDALTSLRASLGLDRPFPERFVHWLGQALTGNLGLSLYQRRDVATMVVERMPTTLMLCALGTLVSVLVGIPLGVISAVRRNSLWDQIIRIVSLVGLSIPSFWVGLLLLLFFSVKWSLFPMTGYVSPGEHFWRSMTFFVLPSISLGLQLAGFLTRLTRATVLDVLKLDYIRTARAKGIKESAVLLRHALRTALLPLVTIVGLNFGVLLGGSAVTETVCNLPGVGRLMVFAITQRDFPLVQGAMLYTAFLYTMINLLVDLAYSRLDPRIRYS